MISAIYLRMGVSENSLDTAGAAKNTRINQSQNDSNILEAAAKRPQSILDDVSAANIKV